MRDHPDFEGREPSAWAHREPTTPIAAPSPAVLDLATATPDDIASLVPGSKVKAANGLVYRLNNVTYDRVESSGVITRAAGYVTSAGVWRWLDLLTGKWK